MSKKISTDKILVLVLDKMAGIEQLLNDACLEHHKSGKEAERYWILATSSRYTVNSTKEVNYFNNLMLQAEHGGYKYIQIMKDEIIKDKEEKHESGI